MVKRKVDLVIAGGTLVSPEASLEASVAVRDGVIVAIGADDTMPPAAEVIDARGRHVLPGAIDSHVHSRDPGQTEQEDWESCTAAAACGGVTTVFDMPSTNPPVDTVEHLRLKQEIVAAKAYVDYGLYGILLPSNLDQLDGLCERGVAGFKCFMSSSVSGKLPAPDDGTILEGFEIIARLGRRCIVHAENLWIVTRREERLKAAGRKDPLAHPAARPTVAAVEATSRALIFAEWTGCRLHIAHESSGDALHLIAAAKARGVDVTVETCPQYLLLTTQDLARKGGVLRCNPPIREPGHDRALWRGLHDGTIDMLSTDHAPQPVESKTHPDIWQCRLGLLGVETAVPLMLTEVNNGRMTINQYVGWASANPAKAWDLYPRKGALQVGSDADILLVDMGREGVIDQATLHSKCRISGWHGRKVRGVPVLTLVRGRIVMRDGELVGKPGWGRAVVQRVPPPRPRNVEQTTAAIVRSKG